MAMMDAGIGVWDAKYVYFTIRPWQVDPQIFYVVPRPNFPSRVYGGIHFRFDCDEGLKLGRAVARLAIQHAGR